MYAAGADETCCSALGEDPVKLFISSRKNLLEQGCVLGA